MDEPQEDPQVVVVPRFGKKGKAYRRRAELGDESAEAATPPEHSLASNSADDGSSAAALDGALDEEGLSVADALRLRQARRGRLGGVGFRASNKARDQAEAEANSQTALVRRDDDVDVARQSDVLAGMTKRFAPQTGLIGEVVNQHMEEYIEAEMARRHINESVARPSNDCDTSQFQSRSAAGDPDYRGNPPERHAMRGRLQEIDLGDEARRRNETMTERARRRFDGGQVRKDTNKDTDEAQKQVVRLGPDGKPWRGRKRRASEDTRRDELVEAVLRENRIDVDVPVSDQAPPTTSGPDLDDLAADDRIAEEFRREFLEAMQQRNRRKKPPAPPPSSKVGPRGPGGKIQEDVLRGPKLGGSRNQRAAMRDMLLKEQEKKR